VPSHTRFRILMMGPPLSGKTTQSRLISQEFSIPRISTGEIFRNEIRRRSKLGLRIRQVDAGKFVPDDIAIETVKKIIQRPHFRDSWLLDGFPRTPKQAEFLHNLLSREDHSISRVIVLRVPASQLYVRASMRKAGENRKDDQSLKILDTRLKLYRKKTIKAVEYFRKRGLVSTLDGNRSIPDVFRAVRQVLIMSTHS
jgi:adenylate kinase